MNANVKLIAAVVLGGFCEAAGETKRPKTTAAK